MTTDTKKLAEFAVEFLGWCKHKDGSYRMPLTCVGHYLGSDPNVSYLFYDQHSAPVLAHLAKREMEKREFEWESYTLWNIDLERKEYRYKFSNGAVKDHLHSDSENEYIALWSAIEASGEK